MKKFRVYGLVSAHIVVGDYVADSANDAINMAYDDPEAKTSTGICHQCSRELEVGDVYEFEAEEVQS